VSESVSPCWPGVIPSAVVGRELSSLAPPVFICSSRAFKAVPSAGLSINFVCQWLALFRFTRSSSLLCWVHSFSLPSCVKYWCLIARVRMLASSGARVLLLRPFVVSCFTWVFRFHFWVRAFCRAFVVSVYQVCHCSSSSWACCGGSIPFIPLASKRERKAFHIVPMGVSVLVVACFRFGTSAASVSSIGISARVLLIVLASVLSACWAAQMWVSSWDRSDIVWLASSPFFVVP